MFTLKMTCGACPESYDVYHEGKRVGSLRLRHRMFTAEYDGLVVYRTSTKGDGCFASEGERDYFLNEACKAILASMQILEDRLFVIEENLEYDSIKE